MNNNIKQFIIILLFAMSSSKELFEDYYPKARQIISEMSLEQKVGQIFFPRYDKSTSIIEITNNFPGGYILFANNLKDHTMEQIQEELKNIQKISKIPLGLGVDEEGGKVNRVSLYFRNQPFPSPQSLYNIGGINKILEIEKEKRDLLRKIGLNLNLAPVADISFNKSDYIFDRTLGRNAIETSYYIKSEIEEANKDNKFTQCLKHFPGYGNNTDTHAGLAVDTRDYETFEKNDFLPFKSGIDSNVSMILISHNIVNCIDKKYPASVSLNMHNILKEKLGFSGLMVTDSLSMGAIGEWEKINKVSAAVLAVNSGNNVIITSEFQRHYKEVFEGVKNGDIDLKVLENAAMKVVAWKMAVGIMNVEKDETFCLK